MLFGNWGYEPYLVSVLCLGRPLPGSFKTQLVIVKGVSIDKCPLRVVYEGVAPCEASLGQHIPKRKPN